MDEQEIRKSAALEDHHWWYSSRRAMLQRLIAPVPPGRALDVGCGSGGNTAVLRDLGWSVTGLEYSAAGAELARARGLGVVQADARRLPIADGVMDLVTSTDMWEHIEEHEQVARETARVLRPGGRALVAVPCSMKLWSGHDVALGHFRRYEKESLTRVMADAGLDVVDLHYWNVLLRPVARARRRRRASGGSEMEATGPLLNATLTGVLRLESWLPVERLPGISLVALAIKPS